MYFTLSKFSLFPRVWKCTIAVIHLCQWFSNFSEHDTLKLSLQFRDTPYNNLFTSFFFCCSADESILSSANLVCRQTFRDAPEITPRHNIFVLERFGFL